jgi:hypothetical protein
VEEKKKKCLKRKRGEETFDLLFHRTNGVTERESERERCPLMASPIQNHIQRNSILVALVNVE